MESITTSLFQCIHDERETQRVSWRKSCAFSSWNSLCFSFIFRRHDYSAKTIQRDAWKRTVCEKDGIVLIIIPYWWDQSVESIACTIHQTRPDIPVPSSLLAGVPIPPTAPKITNTCTFYLLCWQHYSALQSSNGNTCSRLCTWRRVRTTDRSESSICQVGLVKKLHGSCWLIATHNKIVSTERSTSLQAELLQFE